MSSSLTMNPMQRRLSSPAVYRGDTNSETGSGSGSSSSSSSTYQGSATLLARIFRVELKKPRAKLSMSRSTCSVSSEMDEIYYRRDSVFPMNFANIYPHQYTEDPTVAWEMLKTKRPVKTVRQMKLDAAMKSDHVRFVCIACTHGMSLDPADIPPGDVLIVAGDFTSCGLPKEVKAFNDNMAQMKHTFKIAISGNHECTFDDTFLKSAGKDIGEAKELALKQALSAALSSAKVNNPRSLLTNVIYLQDSMVELFGIRIYGTPWQPKMDNWAFNLPRGQPLLSKWNQIPTGVDVLITHTPPLGHGDTLSTGSRGGCVELLNSVVKRIRPKYHVFGHVHEGYGCTSDGYTKFINCCLMNENLQMQNTPVIFDIPVNADTKSHFIQNSKKFMKKLVKK